MKKAIAVLLSLFMMLAAVPAYADETGFYILPTADTAEETVQAEDPYGFVEIDGEMYYIDAATGESLKGFNVIEGETYYFGSKTGKMYTGFTKIGGEKYYFGSRTGKMYRGLTKIGGEKYYFDESTGIMQKGFTVIGEDTYYFGSTSGKMYTGATKIGSDVYTFNDKGVLVRTVYADKKSVALTYDDGPSENTAAIVDCLTENGGLATFFVVGNRISSYTSALKKAYKAGCQIGNHSWSHKWYAQLSDSGIRSQISRCSDKIESVTGKSPKITRTPGGEKRARVMDNISLPVILWSIDTRDWETRNASTTYNSVMNNVHDGSIVLMHDLYKQTADASLRIIPSLVKKGYQLVTVEELALLKGIKLEKGKAYYSMR